METKEHVKRELILEGLDCANCAMKIENGVQKYQVFPRAPLILLPRH